MAFYFFTQTHLLYMNTITQYSGNNKATVCAGNNCVTVYGDAARTIQQIALIAAVVVAVVAIAKALR